MRGQTNDKQLRYLFTISPNTILIGNKTQLDAVTLGMPSSFGYTEIESFWSINLKGSIELVATDSKSKWNTYYRILKSLLSNWKNSSLL